MIWLILFIIAVGIIVIQQYYFRKLSILTEHAIKLGWFQFEILKMINIEGYSYGDRAYDALQVAFKGDDVDSWGFAYGEFLICYEELLDEQNKELKEDANI